MVSRNPSFRARGFTLIELLVVLAIVAVLLTLAVPRYFGSLQTAKESVLKENLRATREALDKFRADAGRYPESLEELVQRRYLASMPLDPITESSSTWQLSPPADASKGAVANLFSGAPGVGRDGRAFKDW
jgi:general secretion pathway protein G